MREGGGVVKAAGEARCGAGAERRGVQSGLRVHCERKVCSKGRVTRRVAVQGCGACCRRKAKEGAQERDEEAEVEEINVSAVKQTTTAEPVRYRLGES